MVVVVVAVWMLIVVVLLLQLQLQLLSLLLAVVVGSRRNGYRLWYGRWCVVCPAPRRPPARSGVASRCRTCAVGLATDGVASETRDRPPSRTNRNRPHTVRSTCAAIGSFGSHSSTWPRSGGSSRMCSGTSCRSRSA
uniref:Putative secreted protein n=1 Tax=Anopheles darlingi TaxID=43151 RepID=A0A2M4D9C5_ANODA